MKKLTLVLIISFISCSSLESDAEKVCDIMTETAKLMPEVMQLTMSSMLGSEESKKEAELKVKELTELIESSALQMEAIKKKYDEDEFQEYLLATCETAKSLAKMGEALEGIDDF